MQAGNTAESWGWVSRALHWAMAALILFQLGLGVTSGRFTEDLVARFDLVQTHKSWGAVIFGLALLRLGWRLANPAAPHLPPATPRWQLRAARLSHGLLYALMLVLPVSGWVMASAAPAQDLLGIENTVFGWFELPDPWQPGIQALEDAARAVHGPAALLLAALIAVHVAAALRHHFVDRDRVLARITFGR